MDVEELAKRIEKVADKAEQIAKRIEKEVGLDKDLEWPFGLALGLKSQRVVLAAVQEGVQLEDEVLAYLAAGMALGELYNFAVLRVPFEVPDAAIRVMRRLKYELVEDRCESHFIEMLYRVGRRHANGVLSALGMAVVAFVTPSGKIVAFKHA